MIESKDRELLRALARRQLEAANSPKNLERVALWKRHNARQGERPIVHVELDTFEQELVDPLLQCTDPVARRLEKDLYRKFYNLTVLDDDWVVPDYFGIERSVYFYPFGYQVSKVSATDSNGGSVGHKFNLVIEDLEEDYEKLGPSVYGVKEEEDRAYLQAAQDAFGDLLPCRMTMGCLGATPTQQVVHLMGMENMCFALYDYPELFSQMMERLGQDYVAFFKSLEEQELLLPTTGFERLNQGTKCFTEELPREGRLTTRDVWGFMDSQESVSISPEQYREFMFPCYQKIASCFGLLSYGCCEPVNTVWDMISTLPNLRKVSVSPWADEEFMGEHLRGSRVIYQRKPSPNFLGVGTSLDEAAFRAHIRKTLRAARGCTLEITQRDVYTVNHDLDKARRYVAVIRQEIADHWQG